MDIMVSLFMLRTEDYVIIAPMMGKFIADMGNVAHIIWMKPFILASKEPFHCGFPVFSDQPAESVRNQQRNNFFVNELLQSVYEPSFTPAP